MTHDPPQSTHSTVSERRGTQSCLIQDWFFERPKLTEFPYTISQCCLLTLVSSSSSIILVTTPTELWQGLAFVLLVLIIAFIRRKIVTMPRHQAEDGDRILLAGRPDLERCDNKISTSKYTLALFLPVVSVSALILTF